MFLNISLDDQSMRTEGYFYFNKPNNYRAIMIELLLPKHTLQKSKQFLIKSSTILCNNIATQYSMTNMTNVL